MTENTRPDPKRQISTLFEIGRLMVEEGLPAVSVRVSADGIHVVLEAYDHCLGGPTSVEALLEARDAWIGVFEDGWGSSDHTSLAHSGAHWKRHAGFHATHGDLQIAFFGAVAVPVPLVKPARLPWSVSS